MASLNCYNDPCGSQKRIRLKGPLLNMLRPKYESLFLFPKLAFNEKYVQKNCARKILPGRTVEFWIVEPNLREELSYLSSGSPHFRASTITTRNQKILKNCLLFCDKISQKKYHFLAKP